MTKPEWIGLGVAVAIVAGVLAFHYWPDPAMPVEADVAVEVDGDRIEHPLPETASDVHAALPALAESDGPWGADLVALDASGGLAKLLVPKRLLQNIVATVNSLDGQRIPQRLSPLQPAPKTLALYRDGDKTFIDATNAPRYAVHMAALHALDLNAAAALYVRYYPLFQQAYRELGFPDRYFNDRLIAVIDHLLDTPDMTAPLEVVRPKVFYLYADPELEALSSGQKTILRLGPPNAAIVKAKLREFRAAILAQSTAPASATP